MDALQHVKSGDPFRPNAKAHNAFVDATLFVQGLQQSGGGRTGRDLLSPWVVSIKNTTGTAYAAGAIFKLSTPAITPVFGGQLVFNAVAPTTGGRYVVSLQPLADDAIGLAMVAGVTLVTVAVGNASHAYADLTNNDPTKLTSGATGTAEILWKDSGTGDKLAAIRWPVDCDIVGSLTADVPYGGTGTATVSGATATVYPPDYLPSGYKFASGAAFYGRHINGKLVLLGGPCPVAV